MSYMDREQLLINTDNPELEAAVNDACGPDFAWRKQVLTTVGRRKSEIHSGSDRQAAVSALIDAATAEVLETGHLSEHFATDAWTASEVANTSSFAAELLTTVEHNIRGGLIGMIHDRRDAILKRLDQRLQDLLGEARELPPLGSADHAIRSGLVREWEAFDVLRTRNDQIRLAQGSVYVTLAESSVSARETYAYFRNYTKCDLDYWRPKGQGLMAAGAPYPDEPGAKFLWSVENIHAELWVPTIPQLDEAIKAGAELRHALLEANEGVQAATKERRDRQAELIRQYNLAPATVRDSTLIVGGTN